MTGFYLVVAKASETAGVRDMWTVENLVALLARVRVCYLVDQTVGLMAAMACSMVD